MPKKKPRNAFFFYMLNFREEQKKKGIFYEDMARVAEAAGPLWKSAPPNIRMIYTAKADEEKGRLSCPDNRLTSTGVPVSEIEARQQALKDAENTELQDIEYFVTHKHTNKTLQIEDIFLMDVNALCKSNYTGYLIGEISILRFNLQDGIKEWYHTLINPDSVPYGYGSDIKICCKEFGLELPDTTKDSSNYLEIFDNIIHFLTQWDPDSATLPIIYTLPDKVEQIQDFISQLCSRKPNRDITEFRIYKLNNLLHILSKTIITNEEDLILTATHALSWLNKDYFMWVPKAGCKRHNHIDKALQCTSSRVKRWAYSVIFKTAGVYGPLEPRRHLPAEDGHDDSSSGNSSLAGSTNNLNSDEPNQPEVVMCLPRSPRPTMSSRTSSVSSVGVGRGRGRLFDLLQNMKLNN